jgi:hypothetical protein
METNTFQLLRPLKVIQLGPQKEAPLGELPKGAEVRVLRESEVGDCIDIACKGERYFALKTNCSAVRRTLALRYL